MANPNEFGPHSSTGYEFLDAMEAEFADVDQNFENPLRRQLDSLGIVDGKQHCLITTTSIGNFVLFSEAAPSTVGNAYNPRLRVIETAYLNAGNVITQDVVLDLTTLAAGRLITGVDWDSHALADMGPHLTLEGDDFVSVDVLKMFQGRRYHEQFAERIGESLLSSSTGAHEASVMFDKYEASTPHDVKEQVEIEKAGSPYTTRNFRLAS